MTPESAETLLQRNGFFFLDVYACVAPLNQRKAMRNDFEKNVRREFKAYIATIVGERKCKGWSVHHKIPIYFGGHNWSYNLVAVEHEILHRAADLFISSQANDMKYGEGRVIRIPNRPETIWRLTNG